LLATGTKLIAECTAGDKIWGTGVNEDDPRARQPARWNGTNVLGWALMEARTMIRRDDAAAAAGSGGGAASAAASAAAAPTAAHAPSQPPSDPAADATAIAAALTQKAATELAAAAALLQTCPFTSEADRETFVEVTAPAPTAGAGAGAGGSLTPAQIKELGQRGTRKEHFLKSVDANVRTVLDEVLRLQKSAKKATAKAIKVISKASSKPPPQPQPQHAKQPKPKSKAAQALSALSAAGSSDGR